MNLTNDEPGEGLVDRLASAIRDRILTGEITVGAQLRQAELAAEFEVSRTPVREALRQLQASGLVDVVPNKGAIVRIPSPWEVRHAYEVRAEVEAMACAHAAERAGEREIRALTEANDILRSLTHTSDEERTAERRAANDTFHQILSDLGANPWVTKVTRFVNDSFPRYIAAVALPGEDRHQEESVRQHDEIIAAVVARDPDRARDAMRRHVIDTGDQLARWYEHAATLRAR